MGGRHRIFGSMYVIVGSLVSDGKLSLPARFGASVADWGLGRGESQPMR